MNNLDIDTETFKVLPQKEKIDVLYANVKEIKILIQVQNSNIQKMRMHNRIAYFWLSGITTIGAFLFKIALKV